MARTVSTVCELIRANEPSTSTASTTHLPVGVSPVSLSASTAVYIPAVGRTMIIGITPSAADGVVKVYAGDGIAATNDITFSAGESGKVYFVQLDTSSFEITDPTNENVGSIKLECSKAGTLVAVNAL